MKFILIGGAVLAAIYVAAYKGLLGVKAAELSGGTSIPAMRNIPFSEPPQSLGVVGITSQAQNAKTGQQATAIGTKVASSLAKEGSGFASAVPIVGGIIATGIGLFAALNKPYGTCAPNAPDAASFKACWKHGFAKNQIPYFKGEPTSKQPGTRGWDFAFCRGASGGNSTGCQAPCDCSSNPCVCAPGGAVLGLRDGTFIDAMGRNLGPAVAKVVIA